MLIIKRFTSLSTVNHHIRNYSSRLIKLKSNTSLQNYINQETHDIQWDILRQSLMENELSVNKKNVDGIIVGMCSREKRMDLATAYLKFMRSQNLQPSDASLGKYLRFRYACRRLDVSSESDESDIIEICDYLIEKNERLHAELVENVISGLCLTKNWQKSLQLIRRVADDDQQELSSASYYVPVILKAIKEDDLETTWTLLKEVVDKNFPPSPQIIVDFLNKFADKSEEVEKIFNILNDQSLLLPQNSVEIVKNILSRRYQTSIVNIKNDGVCRHCRGELENISLNKDEFKKLSKNFMDDVFKRKDIFFHTNPQELENFTNFVEETRPYDCVVDGLNVAYSNGQQSNNELLARNVASVVKYFKQNNQHVLVVGRQHMLKWPKKHIDFIKRNSSFFLAQNISHDDPFLLYAALRSGPDTNIFSRDLMRNHSFHLDTESRKLFRRWQQQHQLKLITTHTKKIMIEDSIKFDLKAHKIKDFWHIPFTSESHKFSYESFNIPVQWICVKLS